MNSKKVSVIIPVYNAQKTIKRCIESVISQTYKNIEIIIVNDGSTDKSYSICLEYSKKFNNIKLLDCKNCGVSKARNKGLDLAKGEIIQFLDSDDFLYKNTITDKVTQLCKKNAQMVITNFDFIYPNGKKQKNNILLKKELLEIEEYINMFSEHPTALFYGVLWNKFFLKSIIDKNNIRFDTNKSYAEDFRFVLEYLNYTDRIAYIPKSEYGYYYDLKSGSLSKNKKLCNTLWSERKELYSIYKNLFDSKSIYNDNIQIYILESMGSVIELYINNFSAKETIKKIEQISNENLITEINTKYNHPKKFRILLFLIKYKLYFLVYALYFLHVKLNIKE